MSTYISKSSTDKFNETLQIIKDNGQVFITYKRMNKVG